MWKLITDIKPKDNDAVWIISLKDGGERIKEIARYVAANDSFKTLAESFHPSLDRPLNSLVRKVTHWMLIDEPLDSLNNESYSITRKSVSVETETWGPSYLSDNVLQDEKQFIGTYPPINCVVSISKSYWNYDRSQVEPTNDVYYARYVGNGKWIDLSYLPSSTLEMYATNNWYKTKTKYQNFLKKPYASYQYHARVGLTWRFLTVLELHGIKEKYSYYQRLKNAK